MRLFTFLTICILSICSAFAQEKQRHGNHQDYDQILSTKIAFITKELNLTPDEAVKYWAVYNQGWDKIMQEGHNVRKTLRAIKKTMEENPGKNGNELQQLMQDHFKACENELNAKKELFDQLCKVVSVEKAAKTFIAEEKFRIILIKNLRNQGNNNPLKGGPKHLD